MKRLLTLLALVLAPIYCHGTETEKHISWQSLGVAEYNNLFHGLFDFYAEGFEPGAELNLKMIRCDGMGLQDLSVIVNEEGWIEHIDGPIAASFATSIGEPVWAIFTESCGKEHQICLVPFPLIRSDGRGHVVKMAFMGPTADLWVGVVEGYGANEQVSATVSSCGKRIPMDGSHTASPFLMVIPSKVQKRTQGVCKVAMRSNQNSNRFRFQFGWGLQKLRNPTQRWVTQNHEQGFLPEGMVRSIIEPAPRDKSKLVRNTYLTETMESIVDQGKQLEVAAAANSEGYKLERPMLRNPKLGKNIDLKFNISGAYKPLQPLNCELVEFIPNEDEDPFRWSEIISVQSFPKKAISSNALVTYIFDDFIKNDGGTVLFRKKYLDEDLEAAYGAVAYTHKGRKEIAVLSYFSTVEGVVGLQHSILVDPNESLDSQAEKAFAKLDSLYTITRSDNQEAADKSSQSI